MIDAEKLRRAVDKGEFVGDMAPLLVAEIKRLRAMVLNQTDQIEHMIDWIGRVGEAAQEIIRDFEDEEDTP